MQRLGKCPMQRRPCSEGRMEGVQRPGKSLMQRRPCSEGMGGAHVHNVLLGRAITIQEFLSQGPYTIWEFFKGLCGVSRSPCIHI